MTMNHLEQQVAGLCEGLSAAGIGSAYHRRTLRETAPDLFENIDNVATSIDDGSGIIFVGGARAYDEIMVVARALFMKHIPVMVVRLLTLARWIVDDYEDLHKAVSAQGLFVLGFADTSDCPLTYRERRLIEEFVSDRIDNGGAFSAQASGTLKGSGWWSDEFVERISRATIVRQCNESGAVATARVN
jgi:hypothetical protein